MRVLRQLTLGALLSLPVAVFATDLSGTELRAMSLNIYGWATMPDQAHHYAKLVNGLKVDILGIQEGVDDWQIEGLPIDYSRSDVLAEALGNCWSHSYQVFYNTCRGVKLIHHERFDLSDGPNAVRTGELATLTKGGAEFIFINVHWDHESQDARVASARETAVVANEHHDRPVIVVGDFNSQCEGDEVSSMVRQAGLKLTVDGGIDCVASRGIEGTGTTVDATPSDHPAVVVKFSLD